MFQRFNVSTHLCTHLWLVLLSTMSIAAVVAAVDIRFLRRSADTSQAPTRMSGWRSKRLTAMACHCCSNSFNSHCCLQCVRVGKRGPTMNDDVETESKIESNTNPSSEGHSSWSSTGDAFSNRYIIDIPFAARATALEPRREVWSSGSTKGRRNEPMMRKIGEDEVATNASPISMRSLLERSRACVRCLKAMRSDFEDGKEDGVRCCRRCKGGDLVGELRFGYFF